MNNLKFRQIRIAQLRPYTVCAIPCLVLLLCPTARAQQNVFNRSDSGTGDWGSANLPWHYSNDPSSTNRGDPDNNGADRNTVFIGHNNNTTMSFNGRFYNVRDLTFQSTASAQRVLNTTNGGLSFSSLLVNEASVTHIFNAPVAVNGNNAQIMTASSTSGFTFNSTIFTNDNAFEFLGAGTTSVTGKITQGGSVTKSGTGNLILSGNNDYTGATVGNDGGLFIDGDNSLSTGNVTIASTGKLGGSGTVGGATTIQNGGKYSAGAIGAVGTQNFKKAFNLAPNSIFEWDLATASETSGFDKVVGAGGQTFSSSGAFRVVTELDFGTTFWDAARSWSTIVTNFGTLTGWAPNTPVTVFDSNGTLRDVSTQGAFTISGTTLNWSAVPETSNLLAGVLLAAGVLRRRRQGALAGG